MRDIPQQVTPLDASGQSALEAEIEVTRAALLRMPTVAAAEAAGYALSQPAPKGTCLPSHLIKWSLMDGRWDLRQPEMLLSAGNQPSSAVLAASYFVVAGAAPSGFTGTEDTFHFHPGLCLDPGTMLAREESLQVCRSDSGKYFGSGWMVHVWPLRSAPDPAGMFAVSYPAFRNLG